ncbi:endonuclease/exonuclease/phosphatase family protein [Chryseobacterium koreense]
MKTIRYILTVFHFLVIVLLLGTLLNAYISPKTFAWLNLLSLTFPVLMIINVLMIIFWILTKKKRSIFFVLCSLMLINPTRRWVNFSFKNDVTSNLKTMTLNIHGGLVAGIQSVYSYIERKDGDVVFAQEYYPGNYQTNYKYALRNYEIVAIDSKYPIMSKRKVVHTGNGNGFFADIAVNGKKIRFINVYLNPFSLKKEELRPTNKRNGMRHFGFILNALLENFKIHQRQISQIRVAIDNSPYPVILAGDFNAVPNSYEYYHLGKGLKDVFMEVGNGSSTSFHDYKFPIRIDYVFCSREIKPISYKVERSVKISDHFPVIAEFKID